MQACYYACTVLTYCGIYIVHTATLQLPSDIERIALTTIHEGSEGLSKTDTAGGDAIQLQLLVTRKVPLIGKLLVTILLTIDIS
jgi:hypothetical protein